MLITGVYIMIMGMATVFVFLGLLVMTIHLTAYSLKYVNRYFPEPVKEEGKLQKVIEQHDDIAVIVAAVKAYIKG